MTRLAIAQIPMHWELADNVAAMKHAMDVARAEGAALCTFAELAVTGFHRRIVEWGKPGLVDPAIDEVRERAASLGLAVAFGAPTFDGTGARFNSHVMVDETGAIAAIVSKRGLTDPEATFFERGASRPVAMLAGLACSAVICREVEDRERVLADLAGRRVDVLLWPGQMRPDPDKPLEDPPGHVARAQGLARDVRAHVVQANWPNALNRPEESAHTGHSVCIAPTGEILFRLPEQGFGVGVFTLGEREYVWCGAGEGVPAMRTVAGGGA